MSKLTAEKIKQAAALHVYKVYGQVNYNAERDFIDGANFVIEKEESDLVNQRELLITFFNTITTDEFEMDNTETIVDRFLGSL